VRRRRVAVAVAVLVWTAIGAARAAAQALPTGSGPGAYVAVGGAYSQFESDYGKRAIAGAAVYVDVNPEWRWGVEAEVRRMNYASFGERQTTLLAGPRWSFGARWLVPYAKVLVGGGRFDFPYGYGYGSYFVVAPGAGLDVRLGRRLRIRVADFEYQDWPGFTFGAIHPYGLSAGAAFEVLGSSRTRMSR
jgi:hypothetical protein